MSAPDHSTHSHPQPDLSKLWPRVKEIAGEALDLDPLQREAFIAQACAGDDHLRREVQKLVRADAAAGVKFLDPPSISFTVATDPAAGDASMLLGKRIGRYRIKRLIGVGGMGAVYEALQEQPRRAVALKVMRSGIASRSALRRFEYEAQLLGRLRHPGVAQVFEAGTHEALTGPVPYFAMEYIPGATPLTEFASRQHLPMQARLELFVRVCDAVHHGHQKGIVHRDLKPTNILVDSSGDPKIIDFGVARATDSDMAVTTLQTDLGQLIGTLQYMSPEQCAADPNDIDTRSDVYSLGVVLYELLTGQLPYTVTRTDLYQAARTIREQQPTRLSSIDRTLRGDLETITLKAIEKDRGRRYQSAAELGSDIARYLHGEPVQARPASVGYQLRIMAKRHKALIAIIVAITAGLVCAVIGTGVGLYRATQERDRVRQAELRARDETRRALSAAEFLRETLLSANPLLMVSSPPTPEDLAYAPWEPVFPTYLQYSGSGGEAPSVEDLLEAAGTRLETSFPNDPTTRADMLHLIGNTLVRVGRPEKGGTLLRQALSIRQRVLGAGATQTIAAALDAAEVEAAAGRHGAAVLLLQPVYQSAMRSFGETDPRTLQVSRQLTSSMIQLENHKADAVALQRTILSQAKSAAASAGSGSPAAAAAFVEQGHLALLLMETGTLEEAELIGRAAVTGLRRESGTSSRLLAETTLRLARVLNRREQFVEAEALVKETVDFYLSRFGPDHPLTNDARLFRSHLLLVLHRFEEAEQLAHEMLRADAKVFGSDALRTIATHAHLSRIVLLRGHNPQEAEERARFCTDYSRMALGVHHDRSVYYAVTLAAAHGALGDPRMGLEILEARRSTPPVNAPRVLAYFYTVEGELHLRLGTLDAAAASLEAARRYLDSDSDPSHPNRVNWVRTRATLAEAQGDQALAQQFRSIFPGAAP